MSAAAKNPKCPSYEELSEYFDNETKQREELKLHIEQCAACQAYLNSINDLDRNIKHAVQENAGTDTEIAERIMGRFRTALKEEKKGDREIFFSPVVWRAAVLLMIGISLGCLLLKEIKQEKKSQSVQNEIQQSAYVSASFTSSAAEPSQTGFSDQWKMPAGKVLSLQDLLKDLDVLEKTVKNKGNGWELTCKLSADQLRKFHEKCRLQGCQLIRSKKSDRFEKNKEIAYRAEFIK